MAISIQTQDPSDEQEAISQKKARDFAFAFGHPIFHDPRIQAWLETGTPWDNSSVYSGGDDLPVANSFGVTPAPTLPTTQAALPAQPGQPGSPLLSSLYNSSYQGPPNLTLSNGGVIGTTPGGGKFNPLGPTQPAIPPPSAADFGMQTTDGGQNDGTQAAPAAKANTEATGTEPEDIDHAKESEKYYAQYQDLINKAAQIQVPGMQPVTPGQLGLGVLLAVLGGHNASDLVNSYVGGLNTQRNQAYTIQAQQAQQARNNLLTQAQAALGMSKHHDELDQQETALNSSDIVEANKALVNAHNALATATSLPMVKAGIAQVNKAIHDLAEANGEDADDAKSDYHKQLIPPDDATTQQIFSQSPYERERVDKERQNKLNQDKFELSKKMSDAKIEDMKNRGGERAADRQRKYEEFKQMLWLHQQAAQIAIANLQIHANDSSARIYEDDFKNARDGIKTEIENWRFISGEQIKAIDAEVTDIKKNADRDKDGRYTDPSVPQKLQALDEQRKQFLLPPPTVQSQVGQSGAISQRVAKMPPTMKGKIVPEFTDAPPSFGLGGSPVKKGGWTIKGSGVVGG